MGHISFSYGPIVGILGVFQFLTGVMGIRAQAPGGCLSESESANYLRPGLHGALPMPPWAPSPVFASWFGSDPPG